MPHRASKGFTLTEIAVAIAILALLLGGLLFPLATQLELSRTRDTQRSLEAIRDALIGFAVANGRLPCPANPTLASGAATAGTEAFVTAAPPAAPIGPNPPPTVAPTFWCASSNPGLGPVAGAGISAGALPWATLGVPETDAWGRRFTYAVTTAYADNGWCPSTVPAPNGSSFCVTHPGNLTILSRGPAGPTAGLPAMVVAAAVISHGRNGNNAFQSTGLQLPAAVGTAFDENTNSPTFATAAYIMRDAWPTQAGCNDNVAGGTLCEFDDLVIGIDVGRLVNRMVTAGRLP